MTEAEPLPAEYRPAMTEPSSRSARLLADLLRDRPDGPVRRARGRSVRVELDRPVPYQLDGDTAGQTTWFSATVVPGSLLVMAPR